MNPSAEEIRGYVLNYFRKILFQSWDGIHKKSDKHTDALITYICTISVLGKMDDDDVTDEALRRY